MQDLTKYVLGVAAKSNVEKRQVGCIIVDKNKSIIAEGLNTEHATNSGLMPIVKHAEESACIALRADEVIGFDKPIKAYVTHPPCPACAKLLKEHDVHEVIVVNAFMKFDSDKLRYDLIDGSFIIGAYLLNADYGNMPSIWDIKRSLYAWSNNEELSVITKKCFARYPNFEAAEEALAKVLTFGARKYKANNWKQCVDTGRYLAAAHRHLNAIAAGHPHDGDSGYAHMDHVLCNLMFLHVLGLNYD